MEAKRFLCLECDAKDSVEVCSYCQFSYCSDHIEVHDCGVAQVLHIIEDCAQRQVEMGNTDFMRKLMERLAQWQKR